MIIYLIVILVILLALSWTLVPNKVLRVIAGLILTGALLVSTFALTLTIKNHYGMRKITTTETKTIYSAGGKESPAGILIVSKLGVKDNRHMVLVYQDKVDGKAHAHFVPGKKNITEAVKKEAYYRSGNLKQAKLVTKTTRWKWRDENYQRWFDLGQENELVKQTNEVVVPKDTWIVVTPKQMKQLQKDMSVSQTDASTMAELATLPKDQQAKLMVTLMKEKLKMLDK